MYINDINQINKCLQDCGNPHLKIANIIHVAGTNGKGSTVNYIASILRCAGYSVNVYTSPHLQTKNERISLNGINITDNQLSDLEDKYANIISDYGLVHFAKDMVLAFLAFIIYPADFTILEVGLGGRLDATNVVVNPLLSVITSISLDHVEILGNTIEMISEEKAGILKPYGTCFIGKQKYKETLPTIHKVSQLQKNTLFLYGNDWKCNSKNPTAFDYENVLYNQSYKDIDLLLPGEHQAENASISISVALYLKQRGYIINENHVRQGIKTIKWRARIEHLSICRNGKKIGFIVDGAHNYDSMMALCKYLQTLPGKKVAVVGMIKSKDIINAVSLLANTVEQVMCIEVPYDAQKIYKLEEMVSIMNEQSIPTSPCFSIDEAIDKALEIESIEWIVCCGSLYLAGSILNWHDEFNKKDA